MLRNLAVLISTLIAISAHAQDASKPTKDEQTPVVLAPRGPPVESDHPDAGVDATTREEPNDCGMEQSFFEDVDVPFATRTYESDPPTLDPLQQKGWKSRPAVTTAGRCLRKYVIQVKSESEKPWPIKDATLVGSDGKVLKVIQIRARKASPNATLNIITAVRTEGAAGPNYMLRAIVLTGEDGQAVVLQDVKLP